MLSSPGLSMSKQHCPLLILDCLFEVAEHPCTPKPTLEGNPKVVEIPRFVGMSIWGEQHCLPLVLDRLLDVAEHPCLLELMMQ